MCFYLYWILLIQHNDAAANDDDNEYDNAADDCDDDYMMGLRSKKICEVQTPNLLDNKTILRHWILGENKTRVQSNVVLVFLLYPGYI